MKKFIKKFGIILVTVCLLFNTVSVSAAQTNVTSKYKTSVTKFLREFCQTLNWQQLPANLIIDDNTKIGLRNRLEYGLGNIGEYR